MTGTAQLLQLTKKCFGAVLLSVLICPRVNPWAIEAVLALQELKEWGALESLGLANIWQVVVVR